ncbi:hypothetical protein [Photorhabdus sp. RW14-46]|uniref:hypothetical protein n=1 Tax=Photorhabdus sp. RW14-46 TaxID=2100168 RepID=UPI0013F40665|nr:hypothetical protein [Photorhabdus sp. RW14-46]NHB63191.1 hypothetical protein [Photorhabdus sp. RW14-46]
MPRDSSRAPRYIPRNPRAHPEWTEFERRLLSQRVPRGTIEPLWENVLQGIRAQQQLNRENRKRDHNPFYAAVAEVLSGELLMLQHGKPLALWSGGFAVSEYARFNKECTTLESTILGGVLDALNLFSDWKCIAPMWNAISRKYVQKGYGTAHIFLRVHAPDSVLYRQEIPALEKKRAPSLPDENRIQDIFWHALYGDGEWQVLREIDAWGNLVVNFCFTSEKDARMAIKNFLVRKSQMGGKATYAAKEMKID